MRSRRWLDKTSGVLALLVSLAAIAIFAFGQEKKQPTAMHVTRWHGMRVDVGPDYTLEADDSMLHARKQPTEAKKEYGAVTFRMVSATRAADVETDNKRCAARALCYAEMDTTGGNAADCYVSQEGSHAGNDFTASGYCLLRKNAIRATFSCWNDDCSFTRSVIEHSFASLAKDPKGL
jgi:hypothetical protein